MAAVDHLQRKLDREQDRRDRVVRRVRRRDVARKMDKMRHREHNALVADLIEYAENVRDVSTMIVLQHAIAHIYWLETVITEIKAENATLTAQINTNH
jgi:hypothetical protein